MKTLNGQRCLLSLVIFCCLVGFGSLGARSKEVYLTLGVSTLFVREIAGDFSLTLVFLHGLGENHRTWEKILSEMDVDHRILLVDLPGHGRSSSGRAESYSHRNQARLLWDLLDQAGAGEVVIIGHSLGGALALRMAAIRPDQVRGLFLISPAVFSVRGLPFSRLISDNPLLRPFLTTYIRRTTRSREQLIEVLQEAVYDQAVIDQDLVERIVDPILENPRSHLALLYLFRDSSRNHVLPDLREIDRPAVVLNGSHDLWVSPEESRRVADLLPRGEFLLLEECGHMPQEELPGKVAEVLQDFLEGLRF